MSPVFVATDRSLASTIPIRVNVVTGARLVQRSVWKVSTTPRSSKSTNVTRLTLPTFALQERDIIWPTSYGSVRKPG